MALFFCMLLGGVTASQALSVKMPNVQNSIRHAAETIASAISNAREMHEPDRGCDQGNDNRSSDLCAQWKSADAAKDAARYAFWTLLTSAIGTGLLLWTLWETRATSRRELRAYISLDHSSVAKGVVDDENGSQKVTELILQISWKNSGNTPANNIQMMTNRRWLAGGIPEDFDFLDVDPTIKTASRHLAPGQMLESTMRIALEDLFEGAAGSTLVYGWVEYDDGFSRKRRRTEFASELIFNKSPSDVTALVEFPHRGPFNGMDETCYRQPNVGKRCRSSRKLKVAT